MLLWDMLLQPHWKVKTMNDKTIVIFFIFLGISFMNSVLFNDVQAMMNWVYALIPLGFAVFIMFITEMSARKGNYYR